jgi:hypothetical protein
VTDGAQGAVTTEQPPRTWFDRVYGAIPLATAFIALLALYSWEAARHSSPWLFTDELELSQISRAVEATGHGARRGEPYFWQTLYTWLIAPAWAITSTTAAYTVVKYIGVIVMTLSMFPAYVLARTVASPRASLVAAVGTAAVPALVYAPMILEEPLSYPYATLAFLTIACALAKRTWFWIAAAVVLSLVGGLIRGELGVLPVVFILAAGLYILSSEPARRWRSKFTVWDWVGAVVLGCGLVIMFSGLIGKFSNSWAIATGFYRGRMIDYGLQSIGSLTIGLGLLPVVAALATLATSKGEERTPERRAFTSLFVAAAVGFGIYTAVKAAYISTVAFTRVEERNVIYLVPLIFIGLALWIDRPRVRWVPLAAAVGFVAYLIVATPYQLTTVPASDSPGVSIAQWANRNLSFADSGVTTALIVVLVIGVALLVAPRFLRGRRRAVSAVVAVASVLVIAWSLAGEISAANYSNDESQGITANYPRPLNWLDKATHGKPTLYLGQHLNAGADLGIWLTEFWNRSLRYVWSVDGSAPGPGPTQTPNTHSDGRLYPPPPSGVDYVLAEPGIEIDGKVVMRPNPKKGNRWFLYKVKQPLRYAYNETGVFSDGQTGCSSEPCPVADSAYNRFSTPGNKPGYAVVDVSRVNACGAPVGPAGVRVTIGKLIEGKDKEPHIGQVTDVQRWTLRIGTARRFVLQTPKPPFRVEVRIAPTYSPLHFGGSDQRLLGGQVGFNFSQKPVKPTVTPPPCS